jgi:hypothetical protein
MNWNVQFIEKWIKWYENDKNIKQNIIETMTHELTHLKEIQIWWIWSSHTLGDNETSFEKMQRDILETYLRMKN